MNDYKKYIDSMKSYIENFDYKDNYYVDHENDWIKIWNYIDDEEKIAREKREKRNNRIDQILNND